MSADRHCCYASIAIAPLATDSLQEAAVGVCMADPRAVLALPSLSVAPD
jgi:hypothetical protein